MGENDLFSLRTTLCRIELRNILLHFKLISCRFFVINFLQRMQFNLKLMYHFNLHVALKYNIFILINITKITNNVHYLRLDPIIFSLKIHRRRSHYMQKVKNFQLLYNVWLKYKFEKQKFKKIGRNSIIIRYARNSTSFENEKHLSKGIRTLNVNPNLTRWCIYLWIKRNRGNTATWQQGT